MTALGKLVRSTAFRLTLVYLLVFILYAAALLAYFALNTGRLITEQITETVDSEIAGLTEQYTVGGLRQLILILENRSLRPGSSGSDSTSLDASRSFSSADAAAARLCPSSAT